MTLCEKLYELRKKNSLTQEEFGERMGVSRQAVSKWETGTAMPDTDKLIQIAKFYNITLDSLLNDEADTAPQKEEVKSAESTKTAKAVLGTCVMTLSVIFGAVFALGAAFLKSKNAEFTFDMTVYIAAAVLIAMFFGGMFLIMKKKGRAVLIAKAAAILIVLTALLAGVIAQIQSGKTYSLSPDKNYLLVLKTDKNGQTDLYRTYYAFVCRQKTQFPYTVAKKPKLQWLTDDICAVTYLSQDGKTHQYVATYGNRGSAISYDDPRSAIYGEWTAEGENTPGWALTANSEGIKLVGGDYSHVFSYSDCIPFGTSAVVLCVRGYPKWTVCIEEQANEVSVCKVDTGKTAPLKFIKTSDNAETAEPDTSEEYDGEQIEKNTAEFAKEIYEQKLKPEGFSYEENYDARGHLRADLGNKTDENGNEYSYYLSIYKIDGSKYIYNLLKASSETYDTETLKSFCFDAQTNQIS